MLELIIHKALNLDREVINSIQDYGLIVVELTPSERQK